MENSYLDKIKEKLDLEMEKPSYQDLERMNRQKDLLISVITHDLINSFNSMLFFSKVLSNAEEIPEKLRKPVRTIRNSSERGYVLLESLHTWAKFKSGYGGEMVVIDNLSEIVAKLVTAYDDKLKEKSLNLQITLDDSLLFCSDVAQLFSVLRNLLSNAIKFSNPNGAITLTNIRQGENVQIILADEGIGMTEEKVESLFSHEEFLKSVGTMGEPGLGFGLLLAKDLVENNEGSISCNSEIDKGTTFTLTFNAPTK